MCSFTVKVPFIHAHTHTYSHIDEGSAALHCADLNNQEQCGIQDTSTSVEKKKKADKK